MMKTKPKLNESATDLGIPPGCFSVTSGSERLHLALDNMKFQLLCAVFAVAALTACDPIQGPGLVNRSSRPVKFVASFSGRHVEVKLEPMQAFWHRQPNLTLEALKVADGPDTKDFSFIEIAAALLPVSTNRQAAVAYVGDGRIIGTTAELLRK